MVQATVETASLEVCRLSKLAANTAHPHACQGSVRVLCVGPPQLLAVPAVSKESDKSKKKKRLQHCYYSHGQKYIITKASAKPNG